jgi:hypothetical protein
MKIRKARKKLPLLATQVNKRRKKKKKNMLPINPQHHPPRKKQSDALER